MNRQSHITTRRDRASALVAVVIFGAIISISAAFAYRSTIYQARMASRSHDYLAALNVAEAGAERAVLELNRTANQFAGWTGSDPKILTETIQDNTGRNIGEVVVQVANLGSNPQVTATGYIPNKANSQLMRTVQLTMKNNTVAPPWGEFGLFAFEDITMTQGNISIGSYDPKAPNTNTKKANIGALRDINITGLKVHGNLQAGGNVTVSWGTELFGQILYGGTYKQPDYSNIAKTTPQKSSLRRPEEKPLPIAPVKPASGYNNSQISMFNQDFKTTTKGVANGGTLAPRNTDITIPAPGTYYFNQVAPTGPSTISIVGNGDVKIFVDNNFDLNSMANFTIKGASGGTGPNVTIVAKEILPSGWGGTTGYIYVNNGSKLNLFADKMTFSQSTKLQLNDGSTGVITVKDMIFSGGALINYKDGKPGISSNLILHASNSAKIGNGAYVAGVFYGPSVLADFSGGMNWWGAVIAKNINLYAGPAINIDESLFNASGGSGAIVTAWTEATPKGI